MKQLLIFWYCDSFFTLLTTIVLHFIRSRVYPEYSWHVVRHARIVYTLGGLWLGVYFGWYTWQSWFLACDGCGISRARTGWRRRIKHVRFPTNKELVYQSRTNENLGHHFPWELSVSFCLAAFESQHTPCQVQILETSSQILKWTRPRAELSTMSIWVTSKTFAALKSLILTWLLTCTRNTGAFD